MSDVVLSFRGRQIHMADVLFLRELIAHNSTLSRFRLSLKVCQAWDWVQPNGQPRDMVCRSLMLKLHRAGHIQLPPQRHSPPNNAILHRRPSRRPPPVPPFLSRDLLESFVDTQRFGAPAIEPPTGLAWGVLSDGEPSPRPKSAPRRSRNCGCTRWAKISASSCCKSHESNSTLPRDHLDARATSRIAGPGPSANQC